MLDRHSVGRAILNMDWSCIVGCSSVSLDVKSGDDVLGNLEIVSMVAVKMSVLVCNG
jgi:hypothetical protein